MVFMRHLLSVSRWNHNRHLCRATCFDPDQTACLAQRIIGFSQSGGPAKQVKPFFVEVEKAHPEYFNDLLPLPGAIR
jgi:hypothetical protein